jgi:hypothetical protein
MVEIDMHENDGCRFYRLTCGKATMEVSVCRTFVATCVDNSSARAYGRMGKTFHGADALDKAGAAYKSSACKAMIQAVQDAERAIVGAAGATIAA